MLFASNLLATSIPFGQASIDGSVTVTYTTISFFGNNGMVPDIFNIDSGSGSFAGLTTPVSVKDLTGGPITGSISVIDFATFTAAIGLINFDLTNIDPGTGTLAQCADNTVGNVCTPTDSPFTLTQVTPTTVAFAVSIEGWAYTGMSSTGESAAQGVLTGQQVPGTITGILQELASSGHITNSYSASFSADTAPEPGTFAMFLIGGGLLGTGVLRGRRKRF